MRHYGFVDYATQGYIMLVGLVILIFHSARVAFWPWVLVAHGVGLALIHGLIRLHSRHPRKRLLDFLRRFYPILLFTGFYRETGLLNQMIYTGYLDVHFLRIEHWLFGFQPAIELMRRFPERPMAELFFAAYFSYYLMIAGVGVALLCRDRRQFAHYVSVVSFVFYICYLIYIFVPVIGPRIFAGSPINVTWPPDVAPIPPVPTPVSVQASVFYQIMAWIYDHFETPGAAFPSSHVAVALATVYFSFQYLRRIRWAHLTVAVLLGVATVYCRYHYVVDVVAGAVTAAILIPTANRLYRKFNGANSGQNAGG